MKFLWNSFVHHTQGLDVASISLLHVWSSKLFSNWYSNTHKYVKGHSLTLKSQVLNEE